MQRFTVASRITNALNFLQKLTLSSGSQQYLILCLPPFNLRRPLDPSVFTDDFALDSQALAASARLGVVFMCITFQLPAPSAPTLLSF
jgi:hypothetical protein